VLATHLTACFTSSSPLFLVYREPSGWSFTVSEDIDKTEEQNVVAGQEVVHDYLSGRCWDHRCDNHFGRCKEE
jgi:hypothetical protein